ncbi:MAG: hypothetical protein RSC43_00930 [Clostridia bacterium]
MNFFANLFFLIPLDILIEYVVIWLVRKVIFNEEQLLRAYEANKTNEITDLSFVWDIFNIENGKIYYVNGYVASVVQLEHGYVYDRPEMHSDIHRECIQRAVGSLTKKGYWFRYYNREIKETNLQPIYKTEKLIENDRGSTFYALETDILNHIKSISGMIATTELETYLIIAPDMYTMQAIDAATEEFLTNMKGGLFTFMNRLTTDEIYTFICKFYDLQSIDVNKIMRQKYRYTAIDVLHVKNIIYDDSYTEEVEVEEEADDSALDEYEQMLNSLTNMETQEDDYL